MMVLVTRRVKRIVSFRNSDSLWKGRLEEV